jgi:hypothetical protein
LRAFEYPELSGIFVGSIIKIHIIEFAVALFLGTAARVGCRLLFFTGGAAFTISQYETSEVEA